jgi:hypothetical protein
MNVVAILFPFISFLIRGKLPHAIASLVLQATIIGWVLASYWAIKSYGQARWEKRKEKLIWEAQHSGMNMYTS